MLDQEILNQLKTIFANLQSPVALKLLTADQSKEADDMVTFLNEIAGTSSKISVETTGTATGAPTFTLLAGEPLQNTGVSFCGIPNGHEFTTLLLAILNADGQGKNLPDESIAARISALKGPIELRTFVSLTCTNCPDVAQALNVIALLNPQITNTVIDGATVPQVAESLNIQSVPTVYAGDEVLSVGRSSLGDLLDKLEKAYGTTGSAEDATPVTRDFDVLVLGGGPAGAAAAIYAARKGFSTAVVAKAIGGQVKETMGIENLISVPETTGPKLAADIKDHLGKYPIHLFENRTATAADISGKRKSITCGNETFTARATDNIDIHTSSQVVEVIGDPSRVSGLKVKDRATGAETVYDVDGVFVQIGLMPNSSLFKDLLPMTRAGEIIVDERCRTSVPGVYAAGDVSNVPYKQIIIAMGEGAKAALSAFDDSMRGEI